jgi:hypothetical protein
MHPVLEEIIACKDVPRLDVLRRWQVALRDQIHPLVLAGELAQAHAQDEAGTPARRRGPN